MPQDDENLGNLFREMMREALVKELRETPSQGTGLEVSAYMAGWLAERRRRKLASVRDDETRWRLHGEPRLGTKLCISVRPRDIRQVVIEMAVAHEHAPRTVRRVYALLSSAFRSMVADEVIPVSPCTLKRGDLPPDVDSNKFVRSLHVFATSEIEMLLTSPALPVSRRVLYAFKYFTACRHGELARLPFEQIEVDEPLSRIRVENPTKARRPRQIPVHPTLQWIADSWRLRGWPEQYGRTAKPTDLVLPDAGPAWKAQKQFLKDLRTIGLRGRRGHDFRRSMITHARAAGVRDEVLRVITHGPRPDVQESYTSWPWAVLCEEMAKLPLTVGGRAASQLAFAFEQNQQVQHATPRARKAAK